MTEDTENQLLEMTRQLIGQVNTIRNELRDLTGEVRMNQRTATSQFNVLRATLTSVGHYQMVQDVTIGDLRKRVERIERRVGLAPGDGQ